MLVNLIETQSLSSQDYITQKKILAGHQLEIQA